jgi:predicted RNA-binding Zn ribbon-like protein
MDGLQTVGTVRRVPAPGTLGLVQEFLNTADIEAGTDALADVEQAGGWLHARGLAAANEPLDGADLQRLVAFREALRTVLATRDGRPPVGPRIDRARSELSRIGRDAALTVAFGETGGARLVSSGSGADAVLGRLLAAIVAATADGTWARLKICRNDACRWSFYDASRNRSGHWCSMSICGNRMKGRAFRLRRSRPGGERPAP